MILLDTNALIWLGSGHKRAAKLERGRREHYRVSPISLLELRLLEEVGKLRVVDFEAVKDDTRWLIDEPPALEWIELAGDLTWTRDIFDRLIVAHAMARGFRIATADTVMLAHLPTRMVSELCVFAK